MLFISSVSNEYKTLILQSFTSILNFYNFLKYNPKWEQVKVVITDKGLTEIVSIKKEFPQASY